jgi:two-component system cell cycle sensor histidine kinase PleC
MSDSIVTLAVACMVSGTLGFAVGLARYRSLARHCRTVEARLGEAVARAECAERAKGTFLACMSHELRTPLNAVIGFAEIMRLELFGALGARYRDYVEDIHIAGCELLELVDALLDIAHFEVDGRHLSEAEVDVAATLTAAANRFAGTAGAAGVAVAVAPLPAIGLWADPQRFDRILRGLLDHAVRFTPRGGTIQLAAWTCPDGLVVSVADSGPGLNGAQLDAVLAPFGLAETALVRRHEGTGLGLPRARRLTEAHGGRLAVDSAPGCGTAVTITFPPERLRTGR